VFTVVIFEVFLHTVRILSNKILSLAKRGEHATVGLQNSRCGNVYRNTVELSCTGVSTPVIQRTRLLRHRLRLRHSPMLLLRCQCSTSVHHSGRRGASTHCSCTAVSSLHHSSRSAAARLTGAQSQPHSCTHYSM